jgi:hypothetical protein
MSAEQSQSTGQKKGCSLLVVLMAAALSFVVGLLAGAGGLYGFLAYDADNLDTLGLDGGSTTKVVEKTAPEPADCPPCEERAGGAKKSGSAYGIVYPIEESVSTEGTIEMDYFRKLMQRERFALQKCYQERLSVDGDIKGELSLQFSISGSSGNVIATATRENTLGDKAVEKCILDRIETWKFEGHVGKGINVIKFDLLFLPVTGASDAPSP